MKSTYLDTSEAHLYYEVVGHGTPVLMLHGNSQSHHVFHSYKRNLQKSYQVILMDSRGHGRSMTARQSFTIHDMACDAAALLDHLGIAKAILLGFSDGANIALEFACCFPERTLSFPPVETLFPTAYGFRYDLPHSSPDVPFHS